mmetsp:Transcript_33012/g.56117  ORF Transcript_33012/g.56117 Transcript_33012/m.56117 type:complete len:363 (-) Transcript_33012:8-1096(-)
MIPSKLRQVRFQFTLRHVCVCHSRCAGGSLSIRNRICASNSSSRLIYSTKAIDSLRPSGSVTAYSQLHSNGPVISLGKECFSTETGANAFKQMPDLFVNTADSETILAQKEDRLQKMDRNNTRENAKHFTSSFISTVSPDLLKEPQNFLTSALMRHNRTSTFPRTESLYDIEEKRHGDNALYHATFTDPTTNEQFTSGLIRRPNVEKRTGGQLMMQLYLADVEVLDGKVYYESSELAENAAAARAIDNYIYREKKQNPGSIGNIKDIKLCLEEPYESAADRKSQQIDYEALLCKRDRNEELYASEIGIASEAKVSNDFSSAETARVDPSIGALTPLGANVNNNLSTIGRITEIWTETTPGQL